ncbi:MAG: hypothetical protein ABI409_05740 [Ramlibacter sp.]
MTNDPKEIEVRDIFKKRSADLAEKLKDPAAGMAAEKAAAEKKLADFKAANAVASQVTAAEKEFAAVPTDVAAAKAAWAKAKAAADIKSKPLNGMPPHAQQFAGDPNGDAAAQKTYDTWRRNFLAVIFCLMVGRRRCRTSWCATTRRPA